MKVRIGFVSNSSSSSFIAIDHSKIDPVDYQVFMRTGGTLVVDGSNGTIQFGWGPETIIDAWSRLNFCYLQALYVDRKDWIDMIEDLLKKRCGLLEVKWMLSLEYTPNSYSYIDHQSCSKEGVNTEMFDSEKDLENFIFGRKSKIVLDNDNGDYDDYDD